MPDPQTLKALHIAARKYHRSRDVLDVDTEALYTVIRAAAAADMSYAEIGREVSLSKPRVHQIVARGDQP